MALIRDAPLILGDTGPFCRFAEADKVETLISYLGDNLVIVREVEAELRFRADQPEHKSLQRLRDQEPPFVGRDAIQLDADELHNVAIIAERWARRDQRRGKAPRGEFANYGEIATVLAAKREQLPVLMDDGDGKKFAVDSGLTVHSSEALLAEMVAAGALPGRLGFLVYERVYHGTQAAFDVAVAAAKAAGA